MPRFNLVATNLMMIHLLCTFGLISRATAIRTTMNDFFPQIFKDGNLSAITWDHAVNSKSLLADALANEKHMIEADVILGHIRNGSNINNKSEIEVIMGHPPATSSDLTLKDFLDAIVKHNAGTGTQKKGVKLDFKHSIAFERAFSAEILTNAKGNALKSIYTTFPLWINGDIARGPARPTSNTVDLKLDLQKTKLELNSVIWSLGWTTGDYEEGEKYTTKEINEMKTFVNGIGNVTFPVRAMYAAKSREEMDLLLKVGTLTIWSGQQDDQHVDVVELAKLIKANLSNIYVDVPDKLWQRILEAMSQLGGKFFGEPLHVCIL